ncbi:hypothetical protein [Cyclobacterium amurskyense]|uniref:Uncharacterized protein n=1 Tax=Cyclobacterium amurskyense TaxID=320787 RepID=A0A0H4PBG6_9BACT|nr:hypothetical protein [Cyclobacterium amurskyense]AKP51574.1 hypothetical protein CA2015_2153 [Cyclobacterium amurskyense]
MGKPKTKEFACVRVALNFSRKDTQRRGFSRWLWTGWLLFGPLNKLRAGLQQKSDNAHNQQLSLVETVMIYGIELLLKSYI